MENFLLDEQRFANSRARTLSPEVYERWYNNRSGHRFVTYLRKKLVVYRLMFGKPTVLDTLTCTGIALNFTAGLSTVWQSQVNGLISVGHSPAEVAESCFIWHPKNSRVEHAKHEDITSFRLAMSWKTPKRYTDLEDGVVYLQESAIFKTTKWGTD